MRRLVLLSVFLLAFSGNNLVGTKAPEWNNADWVHTEPLQLSALRGKVVLLRFFMESACPMCRASAPYLNEFHAQYKDKGLVVIGMYTPKPEPRHTPIETVRQFTKEYGFEFAVALDNDWATLRKYWWDRVPDAEYTSVSFLIDKEGIIRYIHPGGAYSDADATQIRQHIETLLAK